MHPPLWIMEKLYELIVGIHEKISKLPEKWLIPLRKDPRRTANHKQNSVGSQAAGN